jgi:hypothetical protein
VRHQQQGGRGTVGARQDADDVLDALAAILAALNDGRHAEGAQSREQVVANDRVLRRADRVRDARDHPDVGHGARGGEDGRGRVGAAGRRRPRGGPGEGQADRDGEEQGVPAAHGRQL